MKLHANARTCPNSRKLLVKRIEEEDWSLMAAAEAAGISERSARKWLAAGAPKARPACSIAAPRPKRMPHRTAADRVEAIEALRRLRMTAAEIAEVLGMALSTVSRWLKRIGLGKRSRLEPPEPPNRYERKRPGELIHVDVKKLGRISAGRRAPGHRRRKASRRRRRHERRRVTGWEFVHVCVDDATRLAYVEVLADEKGDTAAGFLRRAVAWFERMGIDGRAGDDRQRLLLPLRRPRRRPARSSACATSSPAPTGRAPTARPSASSRRCYSRWAYGRHLRLLGRAHRGAPRLARSLQLQETTRLPRPSAARGSARRAGTTC